MMHPTETRIESRGEQRRFHGEHQPPDQERDRLQVLVGELLSENQKLRFENEGLRAKVTEVEQRAQNAEFGLAEATKWVGMVL
jgi:regulator of replication initiation timing